MISVIIPIYNLAEYLSSCFDSLIEQENKDFEVILVNDGSVDESEEICRQYEKKDARFKLFNKPNGGVSSARNLGLQHARGEWIVFVDGDDVVDRYYLNLPEKCDDIDVIEKSYYIKSHDKLLLSNIITEDYLINSNKQLLRYYSEFIQSNSATLCNKIINRRVIGNQKFDETKIMGEDFIFFVSIISRVCRYLKMSHGAYCYLRRASSASKAVEANREKGIQFSFENMKSVQEITSSYGIYELGANLIYVRYMPSLLSLYKYLSVKDWYRLLILWISFPWANKTLINKHQCREVLVGLPKAILKVILRRS